MDLCIECQANQASATNDECELFFDISCHSRALVVTKSSLTFVGSHTGTVAWGVCNVSSDSLPCPESIVTHC